MVSPDIDEMRNKDLEAWERDDDDVDVEYEIDSFMRYIKKTAATINPETAEVCVFHMEEGDPYGTLVKLGYGSSEAPVRMFYARTPENELPKLSRFGAFAAGYPISRWVWFGDLPEAVQNALLEKHKELLSD